MDYGKSLRVAAGDTILRAYKCVSGKPYASYPLVEPLRVDRDSLIWFEFDEKTRTATVTKILPLGGVGET